MKRTVALVLAFLMVLALCACGQTAAPAATEAPAAATEAPAAATEAPAAATETPVAEDLGDTLVLYSPMTESDLDALITCFNEIYPDINVEVVSGSIGEITAKIAAEADNPQGDLVWGGLQDSDGEQYADLFEQWVSAYVEDNLPDYVSCNSCYSINHLSPVCFCVNKELEAELGLNIQSYEDLLDPALKGKVVLSDPNSSSAAWNNLCNIMAVYGFDSDAAWDYITKLMENLVVVEKSSLCFNSVNDGEYVVGLTYEDGAVKLLQNGSEAIDLRYPSNGTSASAFAAAVIKNAPHMAAAKAMVDFICSADGQTTMAAYMQGTLRFTNTKYTVPENSWLIDSSELNWVARPVAELTAAKQDIIAHWNEIKGSVQG